MSWRCGIIATDMIGTRVGPKEPDWRGNVPWQWPIDGPAEGVVRAMYPVYERGSNPQVFLVVEVEGGQLFEVCASECRAIQAIQPKATT